MNSPGHSSKGRQALKILSQDYTRTKGAVIVQAVEMDPAETVIGLVVRDSRQMQHMVVLYNSSVCQVADSIIQATGSKVCEPGVDQDYKVISIAARPSELHDFEGLRQYIEHWFMLMSGATFDWLSKAREIDLTFLRQATAKAATVTAQGPLQPTAGDVFSDFSQVPLQFSQGEANSADPSGLDIQPPAKAIPQVPSKILLTDFQLFIRGKKKKVWFWQRGQFTKMEQSAKKACDIQNLLAVDKALSIVGAYSPELQHFLKKQSFPDFA